MTPRAPIIPYVSRTGTRTTLEALREKGHWRLLVSATGVLRTEGFPYALENGAFTAYNQGLPFDEDAFVVALNLLARDADFVVVPDIVGEGARSLAFSMQWLPRVLDATQIALIPVQNGIEPRHVESLLGPRVGIFVGGDDKERGDGRSGRRRLGPRSRAAAARGATSVASTPRAASPSVRPRARRASTARRSPSSQRRCLS